MKMLSKVMKTIKLIIHNQVDTAFKCFFFKKFTLNSLFEFRYVTGSIINYINIL